MLHIVLIVVDRITLNKTSNKLRIVFTIFTIAIFLSNTILINSKMDINTREEQSDNLSLSTKIPHLYSTTISKLPIQDNHLPTIQAIQAGITWNGDEILDDPYAPVDPVIVTDSNDIIHICWANYANGRTLYHQMIFSNESSGLIDACKSITNASLRSRITIVTNPIDSFSTVPENFISSPL